MLRFDFEKQKKFPPKNEFQNEWIFQQKMNFKMNVLSLYRMLILEERSAETDIRCWTAEFERERVVVANSQLCYTYKARS